MNTKNSCSSSTKTSSESNLKSHWNETYIREIKTFGLYEKTPEPSLRLIKKSNINKNASILIVGTGVSTIIDELLKQNYKNVIATDFSEIALEKVKQRLQKESSKVKWIVDDLTQSNKLCNMEQVDLWHDRAVLHFFNSKKEQDSYFNLLKKLVKKNGFVIIAPFNVHAAAECSGLPIYRFDQNMLQLKLGPDFELLDSFDYSYSTPSGENLNFVYTLFQRINE